MTNDIRNCYWPGLYNVEFVHNCSESMLVATSRSGKFKPTSGRPAVTHTENCIAVKSYIRHKQLFSCLDRKSKKFWTFSHFSNVNYNRIKAGFELFVNWQLSLQLVQAVGDHLTGLTIHRARVIG